MLKSNGHPQQMRAQWRAIAAACIMSATTLLAVGNPIAAQTISNTNQSVNQTDVLQTLSEKLDIALVLDVSSELEGDNLKALKSAATSFVDTVLESDAASRSTRVALVPFGEGVKLPETIFKRVAPLAPERRQYKTKNWHWYYGWQPQIETLKKTRCVSERTGLDAFSDAAPTAQHRVSPVYSASAICEPTANNMLRPLTADRAKLVDDISRLRAVGRKAPQIGLAWGWYALSEKWVPVWGAAASSMPRARDRKQARKVAVLVSGCARPVQFSADGVTVRVSKSSNGHARRQIRTLCRKMKASGIRLYSVALDAEDNSPNARALATCASTPDQALRAATGQDLNAALAAIAHDIAAEEKPSS